MRSGLHALWQVLEFPRDVELDEKSERDREEAIEHQEATISVPVYTPAAPWPSLSAALAECERENLAAVDRYQFAAATGSNDVTVRPIAKAS